MSRELVKPSPNGGYHQKHEITYAQAQTSSHSDHIEELCQQSANLAESRQFSLAPSQPTLEKLFRNTKPSHFPLDTFNNSLTQIQKLTSPTRVHPSKEQVLLGKLYSLGRCLRNPRFCKNGQISALSTAMHNKKFDYNWEIIPSGDLDTFQCSLIISSVVISCAEAESKRDAKRIAGQIACDKITKPYLKIVKPEGRQDELICSDVPFCDTPCYDSAASKNSLKRCVPSGEISVQPVPKLGKFEEPTAPHLASKSNTLETSASRLLQNNSNNEEETLDSKTNEKSRNRGFLNLKISVFRSIKPQQSEASQITQAPSSCQQQTALSSSVPDNSIPSEDAISNNIEKPFHLQDKLNATVDLIKERNKYQHPSDKTFTYDIQQDSNGTYISSIFCNSDLIGQSKGKKPGKTRRIAFQMALEKVRESCPKIVDILKQNPFLTTYCPKESDLSIHLKTKKNKDLLLLLDICMKERGLSYTHDVRKGFDGSFICSVFCNSVVICRANAKNRLVAMRTAYGGAIDLLCRSFPQKVKSNKLIKENTSDSDVYKDDVSLINSQEEVTSTNSMEEVGTSSNPSSETITPSKSALKETKSSDLALSSTDKGQITSKTPDPTQSQLSIKKNIEPSISRSPFTSDVTLQLVTATTIPSDVPRSNQTTTSSQEHSKFQTPLSNNLISDRIKRHLEELEMVKNPLPGNAANERLSIEQRLNVWMKECDLTYTYDLEQRSDKSYVCSVYCNNALISCHRGQKRLKTQYQAFQQAISKLKVCVKKMDALIAIEMDEGITLKSLVLETCIPAKSSKTSYKEERYSSTNKYEKRYTIDDFIIVFQEKLLDPFTTLCNSSTFSKVTLTPKFDIERQEDFDLHRCGLFIDEELLSDGFGATPWQAQRIAAAFALKKLKSYMPIIRVKETKNDGCSLVMHTDLLDKQKKIEAYVAENNVGSKMLRKMGWGTRNLENSEDLDNNLLGIIQNLIQRFMRNLSQDDLTFDCEFTEEECAAIRKICNRLNLKCETTQKENGHLLVVSRNRTPQEILRDLIHFGGSTSRYELLKQKTDQRWSY